MIEKSIAHLSSAEQITINAYGLAVRKQYSDRIRAVALFGSKARTDDDPESDFDLLVICDAEDHKFRSGLWRKASEISYYPSGYIVRHAGKGPARSGFLSPAKSSLIASALQNLLALGTLL